MENYDDTMKEKELGNTFLKSGKVNKSKILQTKI